MEMFIIAVVAVAAFAAVLVPLFRRGTRSVADDHEFDGPGKGAKPPRRPPAGHGPAPFADADPSHGEGIIPPMAAGPATPVAPPPGATSPDAPAEPALADEAARAAGAAAADDDAARAAGAAAAGDDAIEREVARYREALRSGTLCRKCGQANPPGSRFCADCGADLTGPGDDQEFA